MENTHLFKTKSFAELNIDRRTIIRLCPITRINNTINVQFPPSIETLTRWEVNSIGIGKSGFRFQCSNQKTQSKYGYESQNRRRPNSSSRQPVRKRFASSHQYSSWQEPVHEHFASSSNEKNIFNMQVEASFPSLRTIDIEDTFDDSTANLTQKNCEWELGETSEIERGRLNDSSIKETQNQFMPIYYPREKGFLNVLCTSSSDSDSGNYEDNGTSRRNYQSNK